MADDSKSGGGGGNDRGSFVLAGLILLLLLFVPLLGAISLYLLTQAWIRKAESVLLLGTGLVGFFLAPAAHASAYFTWMTVMFTGTFFIDDGSRLDVPWLPLLLLTLFMTGSALLLRGTKIAQIPQTKLIRQKASFLRSWEQSTGAGIYGEEQVLPTAKERAEVVSVVPPLATLRPEPGAHSAAGPGRQKPGSRDFPIGIGKRGTPVMLNEKEIGMHTLIFGSTGSGKSETIKAFAGALLDLGWDGIIIDLKEDTKPGGLRDWCNEYAAAHGKPYQELRLSDSKSRTWFNSLAGMGPDEMRDTILSLNEFEAAYWAAINAQMLGQLINLFMDAYAIDPTGCPAPTMLDIGRALSFGTGPNNGPIVKKMAATLISRGVVTKAQAEEMYSAVLRPSKDQATSAIGLGSKLTLIYDTQVGRYLLQPGNGKVEFDITQAGLSYVGLDSQGKPELTRIISSALLQRLSVYSSARATGQLGRNPAPRFVIIDEANWVDKKIVQNLLSRARSAGLAITLCTQGPGDWQSPQEGDMFAVLSQNANVVIAMSQGEPESAETLANYIGKRRGVQAMKKVVGDRLEDSGSARMMEDYIVTPDQLRQLSIGEAIVRVGKPATRVEWASIKMRDPVS